MTEATFETSRRTAQSMRLGNVEFREGILEALPVEDGWADVVMANGWADVVMANGGGLPCAAWQKMIEDRGFVDVAIGPQVDTFAGAGGERNARRFEVFGYALIAREPG